MLTWLKAKADERLKARNLYGAVVAQARRDAHFTVHGMPDTPEGRYEMIVLHVALLARRLIEEGEAGRRLAQRLNEAFVTDMDDAMREMGIGDLSVPRKVKKAAAGLYDRFEAYRAAIADRDRLERLLGEVLAQSGGSRQFAGRLAGYVAAVDARLAGTPGAGLLAGEVTFPPVDEKGDGA